MTPLAGGGAELGRAPSPSDCGGGDGDLLSLKCVLVGDGAVGKTSLVVSYTRNGFPTEYIPTAFDNYAVLVTVDGKKTKLHLCDTAGQDDFDRLRPLCYQGTDVFLLCFSVVCPTSYANARDKWLAEIRGHCPGTPIIVVGTQTDLRCDVRVTLELHRYGEEPVSRADGERLARSVGALAYVECSALTQANMKDVFDAAILAALERRSAAACSGTPASSLAAAKPPPLPPRRGGLAAAAAAKAKKHRGLRNLLCCVSAR